MYQALEEFPEPDYPSRNPSIALFFISFYVFSVIILLSLLTATFVEIFSVSSEYNSRLDDVSLWNSKSHSRDGVVISLGRTLRGWERETFKNTLPPQANELPDPVSTTEIVS